MYTLLSNAQAKQYVDATNAAAGLRAALHQHKEYRGGMHWKTVSGRDYLYRTLDRHGNAKSLGPRTPDTEQVFARFTKRKQELMQRVDSLKDLCRTHARINAALRLGTLPNEVADVLEVLDKSDLMGHSLMVIGTNAMHAYESMAGIRWDAPLMATVDVDLLWNHKTKLSLAAAQDLSQAGLLGLLKKADSSYEIDNQNTFRARAKSGFMVDLIRQMPQPPWAEEPDRFFDREDLVATDIKNMSWLLGAPRAEQPVVAVDGRVVHMVAPDPRAFALFKVWLSSTADREPVKRLRDMEQARAVIRLIRERLPHLDHWGSIHSFPAAVQDMTRQEYDRMR
jgi:hypothetical protein